MQERAKLALEATGYAAVLVEGDHTESFGAVADASEIPPALRRRMPSFVRDAVRCGLRLLKEAPESDLVYTSQYGDLASTLELLSDLARETLLSPATFSLSVHNASAGLLGQCLGLSASHTAIAAGAGSLAGGLTEAYARLATGETNSVVLVHADVAAPALYDGLDVKGPNAHLGVRLKLASADGEGGHVLGLGRDGAAALTRALEAGVRRIRFDTPQLAALAA